MTEENTGVMDVQKEPVVESSAATVNNESVQAGESADSLKTEEKKPDHVPYTRFKEINDKYRNTEKEYNEYKEKMKYYETFDSVVKTNPMFSDELNGLIDKLNKGELTKAQEKQVERMVDSESKTLQDPRVDELLQKYQKDTFNRYDVDFRNLAKNDFTDADDIQMVGKMLTDLINKEHPNALDQYNPELISKYYTKAKEKVDALIKRQMGKYIETKVSDDIPSNKPSSAPSHNVDLATASRDKVASHLTERLKLIKE